jgi:hypothetical protein
VENHADEPVSERLGHSNVKMTLDLYSHAIPALEETAAELVAGFSSAACRT